MLFAIPSASFGCINAMLHQTFLFLGQLWQLFEVSQILEFLRYSIHIYEATLIGADFSTLYTLNSNPVLYNARLPGHLIGSVWYSENNGYPKRSSKIRNCTIHHFLPDGWMDDFLFEVLFNSISVISGR